MSMNRRDKIKQFAKAAVTQTLEFEFERMPYRLEHISNAKLLNLAQSTLNCSRSKPTAPKYPVQLHIEPSSACTLHCPLCPSGMNSIKKPRNIMPFPIFKSLMDEVGDHAIIAMLWMWGEPFINPKLPDMIAYARSKNVATVTSTNGQHIQTREEAERLVTSGLDNLVVAMDGATQEVYSQYRKGGEVQKILRCLELIRQAKDSLGSSKPRVNVRTVVSKYNEHELQEIKMLARKYGADMVSRKTVFSLDYKSGEEDKPFTPDSARYKSFMRKNTNKCWSPDMDWKCRRPWNRMTVRADGAVPACEFDFNEIAPFGRGGDGKSFLEAWHSEAASSFRSRHLVNKRQFPFCVTCCCGWIRTGQNTTTDMIHLAREAA